MQGGGDPEVGDGEGLSAAMLPASVAAPAADPELVRARITIRALEEELALVRASEGPDSLAEREALEVCWPVSDMTTFVYTHIHTHMCTLSNQMVVYHPGGGDPPVGASADLARACL